MFARDCRRAAALLGGFIAITAADVRAQSATAAPPAAPWITHTDSSALLGEKRTVRVVTPAGYATATRRYPLLILLDANDEPQFRAAVGNVAFLSARSAIPPMLIVGIENGRNRVRDLTPEAQAEGPGAGGGGGGPQFIAYLEKEVLPMIRERYRTAPYTIFAGHSLGGLMGVYVAAAHPTLAQAVIAMSPSLWVNNESATPKYVREIAGRTTPVRLFTSRGAFEAPIDGSTARLADGITRALETRPNADVAHHHVRYAGDSHNLTQLASLVDGLRWVFTDYSLAVTGLDKLDQEKIDSASLTRAIAETEALHQRSMAAFPPELLGAPAIPQGYMPAEAYTGLAPMISMLQQPGVGIATYTRALRAFPDNPRLHRALATMRLARGDTTAAIADLERALRLATTPATATLKSHIETQLGALRRVRGGSR